YTYAGQFEADIIAARAQTNMPAMKPDGSPKEMKWEKVSKYSLDAYKAVTKTTKDFLHRHQVPLRQDMGIHCASINTSLRPLHRTGSGDRRVGFEIEFYYLCNAVFANRYRKHLFSLYPDREMGRRRLRKTREILNYGAYGW